jgi:hypothetical protein
MGNGSKFLGILGWVPDFLDWISRVLAGKAGYDILDQGIKKFQELTGKYHKEYDKAVAVHEEYLLYYKYAKDTVGSLTKQIADYNNAKTDNERSIILSQISQDTGILFSNIKEVQKFLLEKNNTLSKKENQFIQSQKKYNQALNLYNIKINDMIGQKMLRALKENIPAHILQLIPELDLTTLTIDQLFDPNNELNINAIIDKVKNKITEQNKIAKNSPDEWARKSAVENVESYLTPVRIVLESIQKEYSIYQSHITHADNILKDAPKTEEKEISRQANSKASEQTQQNLTKSNENSTNSQEVLTHANKTQEATAQATEDTGKNLQLSKDVLSLSNENLGVTSKLPGAGNNGNSNKSTLSAEPQTATFIDTTVIEGDLGSDGVQSAAFRDATPTGYINTKSLRYIGITH